MRYIRNLIPVVHVHLLHQFKTNLMELMWRDKTTPTIIFFLFRFHSHGLESGVLTSIHKIMCSLLGIISVILRKKNPNFVWRWRGITALNYIWTVWLRLDNLDFLIWTLYLKIIKILYENLNCNDLNILTA
jgi:hypothetical protein